jgi:serralysin
MTTYLTDLPDFYVGTDLNNQVSGKEGGDVLFGGKGNDWLYGDGGNDWLAGDAGVDLLFGGTGTDTAYYAFYTSGVTASLKFGYGYQYSLGLGMDKDYFFDIENLTGTNYDDQLEGNDLYGNVLKGLGGSDSLKGLAGSDTLEGGEGRDLLNGGTGADVLNGGGGVDIATYGDSAAGITVNLTTGVAMGGEAAGDTLIAIENLSGSNYLDTLAGNGEDNFIMGLGGDDTINGAGGNDTLLGSDGIDKIIGGGGTDQIIGGEGIDYLYGSGDSDQFVFRTGDTLSTTPDQIMDFVHLVDLIDVSATDAKYATAVDDAFSFIGSSAFTPGVQGQLRYQQVGANTLVYGDTNGDAAADFAIQLTNYSSVLTAADFIL